MNSWLLFIFVILTIFIHESFSGDADLPAEFRCDDGEYVRLNWKCDYIKDCLDGSDESYCVWPLCPKENFQCNNNRCIPQEKRCDEIDDCGDGSDEEFCIEMKEKHEPCGPEKFTCDNGQCIELVELCDQIKDCDDGSDETADCGKFACETPWSAKPLCDQICANKKIGYTCKCYPGYKLDPRDNWTCIKYDACADGTTLCSQTCQFNYSPVLKKPVEQNDSSFGIIIDVYPFNGTLVRGGGAIPTEQINIDENAAYHCSCDKNFYDLSDDGKSCILKDKGFETWEIVSGESGIDVNSHALDLESLGSSNFSAMDYHYQDEMLYFVHKEKDAKSHSIYRYPLSIPAPLKREKPLPVKIYKQSDKIAGITVDWIGRKLYLISDRNSTLRVCDLDGSNCKVLFNDPMTHGTALVAHPQTGYLFFAVWGAQSSYIARIGMDGTNFKKINTTFVRVTALTIDTFAKKLYWADSRLQEIGHIDMNGNKKHRIDLGVGGPAMFEPYKPRRILSMDVFDDVLYWTTPGMGMMKAHKVSGLLQGGWGMPWNNILLVHPLKQIPAPSPCGTDNGGCSQLCLISPGGIGFKCECLDGYFSGSDGKTCQLKAYT